MRFLLVNLSFAVASIYALMPLQAEAQEAYSEEGEVASQVRSVLDRVIERPEAVGLSVAIARGETVIFEQGVGLADLEWSVSADSNTVFRIGSVTKQFTAAAIMRLVERGDIDLEDNLQQFFPELDLDGREITIRQLLTHTSGIPDFEGRQTSLVNESENGQSQGFYTTVDGVVFDFQDIPFRFEPGQGWDYSNSNYFLLGLVVEAVDGRSFWQFLQEEFFIPLNLANTRDGSERDVIPNRAQGYTVERTTGEILNDPPLDIAGAFSAGGLVSTAGDLVRWQIALTRGRAIEAESYRAMTESLVDTRNPDRRYGFGLEVLEYAGQPAIGHGGGIPGFSSILMWLPNQDLHVALISNSEVVPRSILQEIVMVLSPSTDLRPQ